MKISQIPDSVFGTPRNWSPLGFVRMPEYSNLYTHTAWPGLIFRHVANVNQAMLFGGVIVGDNNYEMIVASKSAGGVGNWNVAIGACDVTFESRRHPFQVRYDKLAWFAAEAEAAPARDSRGVVDPSLDVVITPKYAMAVVSNISMLGYRAKKVIAGNPFLKGTKHIVGGGTAMSLRGGDVLESSLPPLTQYLVQWAELPFAQDGADFVRKAVPALANDYPPDVRSQMTEILTQVAADASANPVGRSTFVLTRVTSNLSTAPSWGGTIRGVYSDTEIEYELHGRVGYAGSAGDDIPPMRKLGEVSGPFFDANRQTLLVPGKLVIAGGFGTEDMPAQLRVATNFVIDMKLFHKEFQPAADVPAFAGSRDYFELIKASALTERDPTSEEVAIANRPNRRRLLAPLGQRSVEVDLQNLLNRAEAIIMDERLYAAQTGTAFADASNQGSVVPMSAQSTGYVYTEGVASSRGDTSRRNIGSLIYETEGTFTAPEDGTYELMLQANGTTLMGGNSRHGQLSQSSPRLVRLAKGASYSIALSDPFYWFARGAQEGRTLGISGPNLADNVICCNAGVADSSGITTDIAPTHGIRGSNGIVFGTRQEKQDGEVGKFAVVIKMVSSG